MHSIAIMIDMQVVMMKLHVPLSLQDTQPPRSAHTGTCTHACMHERAYACCMHAAACSWRRTNNDDELAAVAGYLPPTALIRDFSINHPPHGTRETHLPPPPEQMRLRHALE